MWFRGGHRFHDRGDAGRQVASLLSAYAGRDDVIVLGLPRGGVPVAAEVASRLGVPLDVFIVRKLGVPGHEELAMGAVAMGGIRVLNHDVVARLRIPESRLETVTVAARAEVDNRVAAYRDDRPFPEVRAMTVLLVDDGLATGASMRAAVEAVRQQEPRVIVVAVPIAARETCGELQAVADEVVCAAMPSPFLAVGMGYRDFSQVSDGEVRRLLQESWSREAGLRSGSGPGEEVS